MEHVPVLLRETIAHLMLKPGADCIDGTLGGAGHSEALLLATAPDGRLLGIDADPNAVARAAARLAPFGQRAVLRQGSFRSLATIAAEAGFTQVQAILLDLGISSYQLEDAARGFSFQAAGPLDMRLDPTAVVSAAEIVNNWPQDALAEIIFRYGEEPRARRVARAIVAARPLSSTAQLAEVVARAVGGRQGQRIHPATRTFQALRIAVNDELAALEDALPQMVRLLAPGGRLAIIAFHSLEDRIVKQFIQREARDCICDLDPHTRRTLGEAACHCGHRATLRPVTRKPIQPSAAEIAQNPRSRSAKLRVAERLAALP